MIAVKKNNRDIILIHVNPEMLVNPTDYDWYEEPEFLEVPENVTWSELENILKQDLIKQKEAELVSEVQELLGTENITHSIIIRLALWAIYLVSTVVSDLKNAGIATTNYDNVTYSDLDNITSTLVAKDFKPGPGTVNLLNKISNIMDEYISWYQNLEVNGIPTLNKQLFGTSNQ